MREFRLCSIICGLFLFSHSCAADLDVNEVEQQNQRQSLCIILLLRLLEIILIR